MSAGSMSLRCGASPPARLFQYRWSASMLPLEPSELGMPEAWSGFLTLSSGFRVRADRGCSRRMTGRLVAHRGHHCREMRQLYCETLDDLQELRD
jgi:hypothetical protein